MIDSVKLQHRFQSRTQAIEWKKLIEGKGYEFFENKKQRFIGKIRNLYVVLNIEQSIVQFENSLH
ncbi:MAG: hypothetical protein ACXW0J_05365, partial [Nitrososphaeraceae archaeon]